MSYNPVFSPGRLARLRVESEQQILLSFQLRKWPVPAEAEKYCDSDTTT